MKIGKWFVHRSYTVGVVAVIVILAGLMMTRTARAEGYFGIEGGLGEAFDLNSDHSPDHQSYPCSAQ